MLFLFVLGLANPLLASEAQISGGNDHSLFLDENEKLWSFGSNSYSALGNGTAGPDTNLTLPGLLNVTNVKQIAVGEYHNVVLKNDGTVWAWGRNGNGQLGDGTTKNRSTPVQVQGVFNIIQVAAGDHVTLALEDDGTIWRCGRVGGSPTPNPTVYQKIDGAIKVAVVSNSVVYLKNDGSVWIDALHHRRLFDTIDISTDSSKGLALRNDGTVREFNRLTRGKTSAPILVPNLNNVIKIAKGGGHSLALLSNGTVMAWGNDSWGQLGTGTYHHGKNEPTPVTVLNLNNIVDIGAGGKHSFAIDSNGVVYSWGHNSHGQLGNGVDGPQRLGDPEPHLPYPYQIIPSIGPPPPPPDNSPEPDPPPTETQKPPGAIKLNLDLYPNNALIDTQYVSSGVLFTGTDYPEARMDEHGTSFDPPLDRLHVITGQRTLLDHLVNELEDPVKLFFVHPENKSTKMVTDFFETKVIDIELIGTSPRIEAYDIHGNFLGSVSAIDNATGGPVAQTLTLNIPEMHEIRFIPETHPEDPTGFSFNGLYDIWLNPVTEPNENEEEGNENLTLLALELLYLYENKYISNDEDLLELWMQIFYNSDKKDS